MQKHAIYQLNLLIGRAAHTLDAVGKMFCLLQHKRIVHLRECLNRRDGRCTLRGDH